MTFRLVDKGWHEEFTEALCDDASELRIISPFIKVGALQGLLQHNPKEVRVITRFNLGDFAEGVSDVAALRKLLEVGGRVRGVQNLHAKLYLFGRKRAIITSCNLTKAALEKNRELGIVTSDNATVEKCLDYFDKLWSAAGDDLQPNQADVWDRTVTEFWLEGGRPQGKGGLGDYGADTAIVDAPPVQVPIAVSDAPQAFVKFLGSSDNRLPLSASTIEEIVRAGCHWTVCYPTNRRPRSVQDGAIIFIGRLTRDPNDIRVLGRAIGMAYREERDDATQADIDRRPWRARWSRYIRVHHAEFVDGTMKNGVSLRELMRAFGADSFASTQRNATRGEGNTAPGSAYLRQPQVELSAEGLSWLSERLQAAFDVHGKVSLESIGDLDWPDPSTIPSPRS